MKIKKGIQKINKPAEKIQKSVKSEIQKHLARGKTKLNWLEEQIHDEKNRKKLQARLKNVKEKVSELKKTFIRFEQKAVDYTEKNPQKALALATTAGLLAASLWNSFQNKGASSRTHPALKSEKRTKVSQP